MKPLVTPEMFKEANHAWNMAVANGDYRPYREQMADRLNAALEPLLAEWEAAILQAAANVRVYGYKETALEGPRESAGLGKPFKDAILALSAPDALARHDAAVKMREKGLQMMKLEQGHDHYAHKYWQGYCDALAALEGKP
jgi:hypothetical protein